MNEYGRITRIVLKHPRDAFVDRTRIESQWRDLRFTAAPDLNEACREYDAFAGIIASTGAAIESAFPIPGWPCLAVSWPLKRRNRARARSSRLKSKKAF